MNDIHALFFNSKGELTTISSSSIGNVENNDILKIEDNLYKAVEVSEGIRTITQPNPKFVKLKRVKR